MICSCVSSKPVIFIIYLMHNSEALFATSKLNAPIWPPFRTQISNNFNLEFQYAKPIFSHRLRGLGCWQKHFQLRRVNFANLPRFASELRQTRVSLFNSALRLLASSVFNSGPVCNVPHPPLLTVCFILYIKHTVNWYYKGGGWYITEKGVYSGGV